jgi:hypothetical protein
MQLAAMQELDCAAVQTFKFPALTDCASGTSLALGGHGFLL